MKIQLALLLSVLLLAACTKTPQDRKEAVKTPYEEGNGQTTATYENLMEFYRKLAREFPEIHLQTLGETDSGLPLHLVTYNAERNFNFQRLGEDKVVVLVLNGIHPGEPDGIDATAMLLRDLAAGVLKAPENLVLAAIPLYNIGGALNRNGTTRANQNGPESYGFRGNARNYDLNRDFIKMDTRNARSFAEIFRMVRPHVFLDTHVSNGADYAYTLTHLFTQHNKLGGKAGDFLEGVLRPELEESLREKGWEATPYVNVFNRPPDGGFSQFMDAPRYSTGYAALWNTPGLMVETHMLKPYAQRVEGTYHLMLSLMERAAAHAGVLSELREALPEAYAPGSWYPLAWAIDSTQHQTLDFKGFRADTLQSDVTGLPRLKYQRDAPVSIEIPYFNTFKPTDSVRVPSAYLLPAAWIRVRERLDGNGIRYEPLPKDTTLEVTVYRIDGYQTFQQPYEGHYPHYNTRVAPMVKSVRFRAGDLLVPTAQPGVRYLLETLEPAGVDSFFNWNFFDTVLQRKEGFSPYVFEETAAKLLESDSTLALLFREKRAAEPDFASSAYRQLAWLYERSPHAEESYLTYPVCRLE
jgi:hypothetical protein